MAKTAIKAGQKRSAHELFALLFGLFLGLAIVKFGNPVILDSKVDPPVTLSDYWNFAWPPHWANFCLAPLVAVGAILISLRKVRWSADRWLWLLPLGWLGWQFISATRTVDSTLTAATLWQISGCVACYFLGAFLFGNDRVLRWLLVGVLAAFAFCLVRAIDQRLFEFPLERQALVEGQNNGWTNLSSETVLEMKHEQIIINTNGVDVANPIILQKFAKGRVNGTMVYPNALAEMVLLLFPISLSLAFHSTQKLKSSIRVAVIALVVFLGCAAFFWTGSKLGWLVGMGLVGVYLFRLNWSKKLKWTAVMVVAVLGLGIFAVRFHNYFAAGATSVGARFDYWRAAVETTGTHPAFGTGPGTFQRPYAKLKAPDAEMARLTHNDFLEQFSDSGLVGGIAYLAWIIWALIWAGSSLWRWRDPVPLACFVGVLGWFLQGLGEFGLYIPASAWAAFTLLGGLIGLVMNQIDKKSHSG
jgi:hypothetical protein